MALNRRTIDKIIFRDWIRMGIYVSLHTSDPGESGNPALFGPVKIPSGSLRASRGVLQNTSLLSLGRSTKSGRATHIGIWLGRSNFLGASKLKDPVLIGTNNVIEIPRNSLKIALRQ